MEGTSGRVMVLRLERFADLPKLPRSFKSLGTCNECIYWECPREFERGERNPALKVRWMSGVLREFGNCGFRAKVANRVVGSIQYAPPRLYGQRFEDYPSGPPSEDAVFISCLYIRDKAQRGQGIGSELLRTGVSDLEARGYDKIEAFPRISSDNNPSGPVSLYLKHGFRIVRQKDDFPLVRLE